MIEDILTSSHRRLRGWSRGFTLIEAVISIALVGLLVVAALRATGTLALADRTTRERQIGQALASDLMAEILTRSYADPTETIPSIGANFLQGELLGPGRTLYDDVDDYYLWYRSPPEQLDGTDRTDLTGWSRSVFVKWVDPDDYSQTSLIDSGVKCITVTVERNSRVRGQASAIRTSAWDTIRADGLSVLFVVGDPAVLTTNEQGRQTLLESWGFGVTLINDSETQSAFDVAIGQADVAYVSRAVNEAELADKLDGQSIGIVNEFYGTLDNFGFADMAGIGMAALTDSVTVKNNTHDITSGFALDSLAIFTSDLGIVFPSGLLASGLDDLAGIGSYTALMTLDVGATRYDMTVSAGRRAHLPFAVAEVSQLTDDAKTILKRSIEWAAESQEAATGGGMGENGASKWWEFF